MGISHLSTGQIAGWGMASFIVAIGIHSQVPYWRGSDTLFAFILVVSFVPIAFVRSRIWIALLLVIASAVIGWWHFERAPMPTIRRIDDRRFMVRSFDATSPFAKMRQHVTARIHSVFLRDEATLVTGILYGEQDLSKLQKERFRSSGLMHIVAVSGSNVTVVVQFISLLVLRMRFRRRHAFWITSIVLFCFVAFVGFAASVARAAFMGWLVLLAREVGRLPTPSRLLLVAATILLVIQPWQLAFDIGFALSFLAMWGLLSWAPMFESVLQILPERLEIRRTVAMTLAVTLTTAPYLAWMFGRISFAGLITNVLALPLIPFIMGWGVVAAMWGSLPGHDIVSAPVLGLVRMIDVIARVVDILPWLERDLEGVSFSTTLATYALMVYFLRTRREENDLSTIKRRISS